MKNKLWGFRRERAGFRWLVIGLIEERLEKRISGSLNGDKLALEEEMPSLANSPSATSIWQRPQSALPPQTESMSTPRLRAACSTGVPTGKWPRLPEGVKTTRGSRVVMGAVRRAAAGVRLRAGPEAPRRSRPRSSPATGRRES